MCISDPTDIQNTIEDKYIPNDSIRYLNQLNRDKPQLKKVVCPIIPSLDDPFAELKLNFAI